MKKIQYAVVLVLSLCLGLQSWALVVPARCHHSADPLGVSGVVVQAQTMQPHAHAEAQANAHDDAHDYAHADVHSHADPIHPNPAAHPHRDQHRHRHLSVLSAGHLQPAPADALVPSPKRHDHQVTTPDPCCKFNGSCCLSAALLPAMPSVKSPVLAQAPGTWEAPWLLCVAPRAFDKPPKHEPV